ncbi:pyridoxamine 5'-phosphate oxidase family protein [Kineococcus sp. SYSU DK004]|uniref:pyridoxamine 5'-phosphate oxidase family protein n=1 Tax=Kineococcus sp. SYSU DK004 TaxID=3383125 RepID=UPI003D7DB02E
MTQLPLEERTRIRRKSDRQVLDVDALHAVLDDALVAHVALVRDGLPVVLPVAVARDGDDLLLHGSTGAGLFRAAASPEGLAVSVAVTHLDGLVLARSVADTSMNYRSAVVHGVAHLVPVPERERALRVLTEHLAPGRWDEVRAPTRQELAATAVLRLPLALASVKVRAHGPSEDAGEDADVWAGVLPLALAAGTPRASALTRPGTAVPGSARRTAGRLRPAP